MRSMFAGVEPAARHARQQILERIDRRMHVTSRRMELEVALRDQPLGSQTRDRFIGIERVREHFAVDVAHAVDLAREAAFDEPHRGEPHVARVTGEDVPHGRAVEQRVAARRHAHRGGDVEELEHLRGIEVFQPCGRDCSADHAVRPVRMNRQSHLCRTADARGHFIPERDRSEQVLAFRAQFLCERDGGRHHLDSGMAFRKEIAFVELEPRAGGAVEQRCVEHGGAPSGADHPRSAGRGVREMALDERFHFGFLHPGRDHRYAVREHPAGAIARGRAYLRQSGRAGELGEAMKVSGTGACVVHVLEGERRG